MTKEFIRQKITTDQKWMERAILAIYQRQTEDEKRIEENKYLNNKGFTAFDAKSMSYYAKWIKAGRHLTGKHLSSARRKISKYAGQLLKIVNKEI